jgi:nucleoid DNA-binding protein
MTKTELVDYIVERIQLPKYQTEAVVTSVLQGIMDALCTGDTVALRGFGSFRLHRRAPRGGRKPQTGAMVEVPPTHVPRVTAGEAVRALGNQPER